MKKGRKNMALSLDERLVQVVPSERQLRHQSMEFYGFIHFTVNTFTDREWGEGTEDSRVFNPTDLDAAQWAHAAKEGGMTGLILTCKHHDGFCLWPSRYTDHSVASSPFRGGKGDVVRELSDACRREGLAFGVYLSPWDRNCPLYGTGRDYDDYFIGQLEELLTGYGDIFCVWFDGACGEGPNGKKQQYDWERYYETIRRLQPNACISVCGPDVRWCGNEAGHTRPSEWSVVPLRMRNTEKIAHDSQQQDDEAFRERSITAGDLDLGSREVLQDEKDLIWYPAEVNTSIRPGWFYHAKEDNEVKPLEKLIEIYENSVGGNATFLLNLPPDTRGRIHENDVARLREFGAYLRDTYAVNRLAEASLSADVCRPGSSPEHVREDSLETWFSTPDGVTDCRITMRWKQPISVSRVVIKENIRLSQRIERFELLARTKDGLTPVYEGTVVGYKRIAAFPAVETDELVLHILDARVCPTIAFIGVY